MQCGFFSVQNLSTNEKKETLLDKYIRESRPDRPEVNERMVTNTRANKRTDMNAKKKNEPTNTNARTNERTDTNAQANEPTDTNARTNERTNELWYEGVSELITTESYTYNQQIQSKKRK